jgi:hypothetical protein
MGREDTMDPRIESALAELDGVHNDVVEFVRGCDEREWREMTVEGWPVGVVAHHIAVGHVKVIGWLDHLRRGEAVPGDPASHDEGNAQHAAEFDATTREQTLGDLEANKLRLGEYLTGIRPEEMSREAVHGPAGGVVISVERMMRATGGHARAHLANMREVVERDAEERAS